MNKKVKDIVETEESNQHPPLNLKKALENSEDNTPSISCCKMRWYHCAIVLRSSYRRRALTRVAR